MPSKLPLTPLFKEQEIDIQTISAPETPRRDLGDLESLKSSIQTHGLLHPIILNEQLEILAGERRYRSCIELGIPKIPVRIIKGISKGDSLIIELIENVERKSFEWHEEIQLKARIHKFFESKYPDWSLRKTAEKLGLVPHHMNKDIDLAAALNSFPELKAHESKSRALNAYDKLARHAKAIISLDELSEAERARLDQMMDLHCGFASEDEIPTNGDQSTKPNQPDFSQSEYSPTEQGSSPSVQPTQADTNPTPKFKFHTGEWSDLLVQFPEKTIGFAELDPPYAMDFDSKYTKANNLQSRHTDWTPEQYRENMTKMFELLLPRMIPDSWILYWTAYEWVPFIEELAHKNKLRFQKPGVWMKPSGHTNNVKTNLLSNYEMFVILAYGKPIFNTPSLKAAFEAPPIPGKQKIHDWEKPIEGVYDYLFTALARPNTFCFVPFAGSGNSMRCAIKHGMIPIGSDTDETCYYHFINRLAEDNKNA